MKERPTTTCRDFAVSGTREYTRRGACLRSWPLSAPLVLRVLLQGRAKEFLGHGVLRIWRVLDFVGESIRRNLTESGEVVAMGGFASGGGTLIGAVVAAVLENLEVKEIW